MEEAIEGAGGAVMGTEGEATGEGTVGGTEGLGEGVGGWITTTTITTMVGGHHTHRNVSMIQRSCWPPLGLKRS